MKKIKLSEAILLKDKLGKNIDNEYRNALRHLKQNNRDLFNKSIRNASNLKKQLISLKEQIADLNQKNPWYLRILTLNNSKSNNYYIYLLCELKKERDFKMSCHNLDSDGIHLKEENLISAKISNIESKLSRFNEKNFVKI